MPEPLRSAARRGPGQLSGSIIALLTTCCLGGVLSLDRTCFGQFLFSRPLFAASLLGLLLGVPEEGVFAGIALELLFLHSLPVGSHIPYHPLYPSLVAVYIIFVSGNLGFEGLGAVSFAVIVSLPAAFVDRIADLYWRRSNSRLVNRATAYVRLNRFAAARALHLTSILRSLLVNLVGVALAGGVLLFLALTVLSVYPGILPYAVPVGFAPFFVGLAGLSASKVRGKGWIGFACGALAGAVVGSGIIP